MDSMNGGGTDSRPKRRRLNISRSDNKYLLDNIDHNDQHPGNTSSIQKPTSVENTSSIQKPTSVDSNGGDRLLLHDITNLSTTGKSFKPSNHSQIKSATNPKLPLVEKTTIKRKSNTFKEGLQCARKKPCCEIPWPVPPEKEILYKPYLGINPLGVHDNTNLKRKSITLNDSIHCVRKKPHLQFSRSATPEKENLYKASSCSGHSNLRSLKPGLHVINLWKQPNRNDPQLSESAACLSPGLYKLECARKGYGNVLQYYGKRESQTHNASHCIQSETSPLCTPHSNVFDSAVSNIQFRGGDREKKFNLVQQTRIVRDLSSIFDKGSSSQQVSDNQEHSNSDRDREDLEEDEDEEDFDEFEPSESMTIYEGYSDIGDPVHACQHCGAKFWLMERLQPKRKSDRPVYSKCCAKGKIILPLLTKPPDYLLKLFIDKDDNESKNFQQNIRAYNMMFSFTSMGGKIDTTINDDAGRYVYRLSGQNHHRIGSLLPPEGQIPRFAQLYIHDTQNEVNNRLTTVRGGSSEGGSNLNPDIVEKLQRLIDQHNPIAKLFRMTRDRLAGHEVPNMKLRLLRKRGRDSRLYNKPTTDEIGALVVGDVDVDNGDRDIIVETRSGMLQRINELHPLYIPMHYVLCFIYGEDGYCDSTPHSEMFDPDVRRNGKLTLREFFAFRFQPRDVENAIFLYGRRLFQQFVVDAYAMVEAWRLNYIRFHQKKLRQDVYKGLTDAVFEGERDGAAVGKRIVLPSSFTGGARYLMQNYQDAMAICKWAGYPDIFITFTCNPKWPESTRYTSLLGLKIEDRPDIAVRIFKIKLKQLMTELKKGHIFGRLKAAIYTIEFQKRGLPHAHILLFLYPQDKHPHPEDIDKIISAEIPNEKDDLEMHELVKEFMVHGPCGAANRRSPCMIDGRCSKYYPKQFEPVTKVNEEGYPIYRRRDDGTVFEKGGFQLDNRSIVAHNRKLLRKFRSHINTEWCNQSRSIKYLFKYISKGSDRVTVALYMQSSGDPSTVIDEIKCYYDCRYISPCEAMWRIFAFEINYRNPSVERLKFHLPGEQSVLYKDDDDLEEVLQNPANQKSMFMAWMEANQEYELAKSLTYLEFPSKFVYKSKERYWQLRKKGLSIGRLTFVPPSAGELYYLSLLINRVKGPESYSDIRTIDGIEYPTFRDACYSLGLLDDDAEFIDAIIEAKDWATGNQLRTLFVSILLSCSISRPEVVWEATWKYLSEDLVYPHTRLLGEHAIQFSDTQIQALGLVEIDNYLIRSGKSLKDFPSMPQPDYDVTRSVRNSLIAEQLNFNKTQLAQEFTQLYNDMNEEQKIAFNKIIQSIEQDSGGFFFLNGYGGTGKTFLWRALSAKLRCEGKIMLTVASSGIAATLLPAARTAHSRFHIPIAITEDSTCNIKKGSFLAEMLIATCLIIWDEAPMVRKYCFEALDRTMRDLLAEVKLQSQHLPFGGKKVVLGGDFRQILPVIPGGKRSDVVFNTINSSNLWFHCEVLKLTRNMRLQMTGSEADINELRDFSKWMLDIGDGNVGECNDGEAEIQIPNDLILTDFDYPLDTIFQQTYPDFEIHYSDPDYLKDRAILTPTLDIVDEVNSYMMSKLPGDEKTYLSSDTTAFSGEHFDISAQCITPAMLNDLKISGLPNHVLKLKVGAPIMLLRNIDQAAGLCNGTRLIVTQLANHVIGAKVISGGSIGSTVFLTRMSMIPSESRLPFRLQRRQFPVVVSFCMTVYLPRPVFTHGQLYVAISRVKSKKGLKFVILDKEKSPSTTTQNVVYKEIFQNIS